MKKVLIDGKSLTIEDVVNVCRHNYKVEITDDAIMNIKKARALVDKLVDEEKISYGITTGFENVFSLLLVFNNFSLVPFSILFCIHHRYFQ